MNSNKNYLRKIAFFGILILTLRAVITTGVINSHFSINETVDVNNSNPEISIRLLYNAGVMIEAKNTRIYIDPFNLTSNYSDYPADAVLITHNHSDHYDPTSIDIIKTENTSFYFPAIMSEEVLLYEAYPVVPEDTFVVNNISVRCFYMYTMPGSPDSTHPQSHNYTSYIIEIEGFTIFHAGDSWNIEEYQQLTGEIDLVFLPLGPGCQTMAGIDVVSVIQIIEPSYFIPIHFTEEGRATFLFFFLDDVENSGCQLINLDYYSSCNVNQLDTMTTTTTDASVDTTTDTSIDTTTPTTNDNGSDAPGFSLIVTILAGAFVIIKRRGREKKE